MSAESTKRNSFVALCEIASQNNWCWNLSCTTCGHGAFKVAFSKLIKGEHPDDESFWPNGKENHSPLKETDEHPNFFRNTTVADQLKLAEIVAKAKVLDIQSIARFPDWLGYIGLVFNHCSSNQAQKILSDSLLPQFINLTETDREDFDYLNDKQANKQLLNLSDLSRIETFLQNK